MHTVRPVLFERVGNTERWIATDHARGPWNPDHCHGGPPSSLLTRACELAVDHESDPSVEWQIARLTIELMRAVPVGVPLEVRTTVERPGRKVALIAAQLFSGETEVARARALRIRRQQISLPEHPRLSSDFETEPGAGRLVQSTWALDGGGTAFHRTSCEHRFVEGGWDEQGPCKVWIRLLADIVADESPSSTQRTAALADFGNGVSAAIEAEDITYINPDLTIHMARPSTGEWIGLASHSVYGTATESSGSGFAESSLHDEHGRFGRSIQSLLIQPG